MADGQYQKNNGWFWFAIFTILIFWIPTINVQPSITTGDMGRDFYASQMTLQAAWPCRDYWWQYGPLMPLYYAFWFLVGGVNLVSMRLGLGIIYLLCSILGYRTLRLLISPPVAFLSSLAFLNLNMTWTFNHMGAIPSLLVSVFSLWKFFLTRQTRWCYFALLALVGVALVKINVGVTSFLAFYASLLLDGGISRWKYSESPLAWKHFLFLPFIFGGVVLGAYALVYFGLPLDQINQCLTILPQYRSLTYSPWTNFKHLVLRFLVWERIRLLGLGTFLILGASAIFGLRKTERSTLEKKIFPAVIGSLLFLGLANSVEYFAHEGMIYRFDFWIFPILVLWAGLMAEWASHLFGRRVKLFFGGLVFLLLLWSPFRNLKEALAWKTPDRYLDFPRGRVYLGGPLSDVRVIKEGTRFIIENTKPAQEILAVPYDPLYCFLSGRRHAVRELIFMKHNHIQEKQEEEIIRKLEAEQIPLVLISSRYRSQERGVGHFGKTHCQRLAQYIFSHYREVRTFGPWGKGPQFHAIKFFQRKS